MSQLIQLLQWGAVCLLVAIVAALLTAAIFQPNVPARNKNQQTNPIINCNHTLGPLSRPLFYCVSLYARIRSRSRRKLSVG